MGVVTLGVDIAVKYGSERIFLFSVCFFSTIIAEPLFLSMCNILSFLFPALGGLLFGYDIGATSGAAISLQVKFPFCTF